MEKKKQKNTDHYKKMAAASAERHFKYIDIIVSSGEIRRRFFQRCRDLNIDPYRVAMAAGFQPSIFKKFYVNAPEPVCTRSFDQEKFIKMLEFVGIDIKVSIIVKPFSETFVRLRNKGILKDE